MVDLIRNDRIRRLLFDAVRLFRAKYFGRSREVAPELIAETDEETLVTALVEAGYVYPWLLSYHYEGEDRNLVRFFHDPEGHPELPHRQDHVRLFVDEHPRGEIGVAAHTEASSITHRDAHIDGRSYERGPAVDRVATLLTAAGIEYRRRD